MPGVSFLGGVGGDINSRFGGRIKIAGEGGANAMHGREGVAFLVRGWEREGGRECVCVCGVPSLGLGDEAQGNAEKWAGERGRGRGRMREEEREEEK